MSPLILSRNLIKWMVPLSGLPSFGTATSCTEVHMVWAPQCRSLASQTCSLIVSSLSPWATEYFRKGRNIQIGKTCLGQVTVSIPEHKFLTTLLVLFHPGQEKDHPLKVQCKKKSHFLKSCSIHGEKKMVSRGKERTLKIKLPSNTYAHRQVH